MVFSSLLLQSIIPLLPSPPVFTLWTKEREKSTDTSLG